MCGRGDDDSINVRLFPFAYFAPMCIFKEKYYKLTERRKTQDKNQRHLVLATQVTNVT